MISHGSVFLRSQTQPPSSSNDAASSGNRRETRKRKRESSVVTSAAGGSANSDEAASTGTATATATKEPRPRRAASLKSAASDPKDSANNASTSGNSVVKGNKNKYGETPLHVAVKKGDLTKVNKNAVASSL